MILVSLGGLSADDLLTHLADLPNLRRIVAVGAYVKRLQGILPAQPNSLATTLVTGRLPQDHQIMNQTKFQPQRVVPTAYWSHRDIVGNTLYDLVRKQHQRVASFNWPVTADSRITYNLCATATASAGAMETALHTSNPPFVWRMGRRFARRQSGQDGSLDAFMTACAVDTIQERQPRFTLLRLAELAQVRVRQGHDGPDVLAALQKLDHRVGDLLDATIVAGTFTATNFVLIGEPALQDVQTTITLNQRFATRGWLTPLENGTVQRDWHVYAQSCGGSTYVYTRNFADQATLQALLTQTPGVARVVAGADVRERGTNDRCRWWVTAKAGYAFSDLAKGNAQLTARAVYGHDHADEAPMVLAGPAIKSDQLLDHADWLAITPTLAQLLHVRFPEALVTPALTTILN